MLFGPLAEHPPGNLCIPIVRYILTNSMSRLFRILIVEDDADIREVESQVLGYAGYQVRSVRNGREALDALAVEHFSLIVLDLMMPVMDGLTFLNERRRLGIAEHVPVVCVSAATHLLSQAIGLGAQECLQKPTDFDQLCDRVEHYCSRA